MFGTARANAAGLLVTLALHVGAAAGVLVARAQAAAPVEAPRDFVVAKLVKLGKPRPKFWLPRIAQPSRPKAPPAAIKLSSDPNAAAAPPEAPRPEDPDVSKDVKRALQRARALSQQAAPEEPAEGLATGVEEGTASEASVGDEYATAIAAAIRKHWTVPAELVAEGDLAKLEAEVRIKITEDGALSGEALTRPSGNSYFDDSCLQAVKAAATVPPPPARLVQRAARGFSIVFAGKDVGR